MADSRVQGTGPERPHRGKARRLWPRVALALVVAALLAGCGNAHDDRVARGWRALLAGRPVGWRTLAMPRHVPAGDFTFECDTYADRIDSRAGTYTWLLGGAANHPKVALFTLSPAERDSIWSWMLDADYFDMPPKVTRILWTHIPAPVDYTLQVRVRDASYSKTAETVYSPLAPRIPHQLNALERLCMRTDRLVEQDPVVQRLPRPRRIPLHY